MILLILIIIPINYVTSKTCALNHTSVDVNWEEKLHKYLHCPTYNYVPPSNFTNVSLQIKIISFYFNNKEEVFSIYYWARMSWNDDRLKWDPKQFGNISRTVMRSSRIWTPGLKLIHSAVPDDLETFYYTSCGIQNTGRILCIPRVHDAVICNTKLKDWPYDVQKCVVEFGAWQRAETEVRFNLTDNLRMITSKIDGQWLLEDYLQLKVEGHETQIRLTFILKRQSLSLAAIVISPALILTLLTITTLFLDARANIRLGLTMFSLANHLLFLTVLQETIPEHRVDYPSLLAYYKASFVITVLLILLTQFLKVLCSKEDKNDDIIRTVINFILAYRIRRAVLWWEYEDKTKVWTDFASFVNSVCLYVIIIIYFFMYLMLIPKPATE